MADSTTVLGLNYVKVPSGTTAERPSNPAIGYLWYNTSIGYLEYYGANGWNAVAAPPTITTVSPTSFNGESGTTITVNGSGFDNNASVQFILTTGATLNASTTTRVSASQLLATIPRDLLASESPLDVKVANGSGLSYVLDNCISFADVPVFNTASGSIGSIYDSNRSSTSHLATMTASDSNGGSIASYSIVSGSIPSGLSFNTSTAALSGTANAVGSDTTSTFTVRATDNAGNTTDRSFSITVRAPVVVSFTSVGSSSWSVPVGVNTVRALVVAGGGAGGTRNSGWNSGGTDGGAGAGAGGMIDHPGFSVTPGGSVSYTVGGGAGQNYNPAQTQGSPGGNSVFGALTAIGGGGGGAGPGGDVANGLPGGSGGGRGGGGSANTGITGTGVQPSQPGASGTFGYGFPGGFNPNVGPYSGAGGGGAGGAGTTGGNGNPAPGGTGRISTVTGSSVYYAGGGGGASGSSSNIQGSGGAGGGGPGNPYNANGSAGGTNTGGGGGGGSGGNGGDGGGGGGAGGPGVIIIRY
jgi:hypothetical protein